MTSLSPTPSNARSCRYLAALFIIAAVLAGSHVSSRADQAEVDRLVDLLQISSGSVVADVGAGSGDLSMALAARVGSNGKMYSTEIDPKMLEKIRTTIRKANVTNMVVIAGTAHDTELPPSCCDAIVLRKVYHHLTDPADLDRSLFSSLRPGGRLAIIDFEPSADPGKHAPAGVPSNRGGHGAPKPIVEQELRQAGFQLVTTIDWPVHDSIKHYCMLFIKPAPSAAKSR